MKAKYIALPILAVAAIALIIVVMISRSHAGYPMISGIPNQYIYKNSQTGVIPFNVYDDTTSPDDLELSYKCDTPSLVPEDDDNIILGGSGSARTVQVKPASDQTGRATITITVEDTSGETNQDSFEVEVTRAPQVP